MDKGAHYHELFLRGKRYLAHRIVRNKIKGKGARKPANPQKEPDFYSDRYLPLPDPSSKKSLSNVQPIPTTAAPSPVMVSAIPLLHGFPSWVLPGASNGVFPILQYPTQVDLAYQRILAASSQAGTVAPKVAEQGNATAPPRYTSEEENSKLKNSGK